jgi:hypothetical protein
VRKIQAHHIHAGSNQIADDSLGIRSRPERGHDFGAALGWGFVQADFRKRHETAPGLILVGSKGFSIGYEGCNGDAAASIVNGSGGNQLAGVLAGTGKFKKSRAAAAFSILVLTETTMPSGFFLMKKPPSTRPRCQYVERNRSDME